MSTFSFFLGGGGYMINNIFKNEYFFIVNLLVAYIFLKKIDHFKIKIQLITFFYNFILMPSTCEINNDKDGQNKNNS